MKSVFIVDDDPAVIKGLLNHVSWSKLNIEIQDSANDGVEAIEKVRRKQPDILITDIYMPKMNGLELIKKVHDEFSAINIIIHSGYDDFDNAREAMKYGVKHFLLKPSIVSEIESILREVVRGILVKEKQKRLLYDYDKQMNEYVPHIRELFFREILVSKHKATNIPAEKLELLHLNANAKAVVVNMTIIRPPYLTKSKESEWQLNKFASSNIIKETIEENKWAEEVDIHVVDYSESTFLLICIAKEPGSDLNATSIDLSQKLVDNILLYIELSLVVGIGDVKQSICELADSYIESEKAVKAAEYQEINRVYTYGEVYNEKQNEIFQYPLDILKEMNNSIHHKEFDLIMENWGKLESYLSAEIKLPVFVTRNICISIVCGIMIQEHSDNHLKEETRNISTYISEIYGKYSSKEIIVWMRKFMREWLLDEQAAGKKSNKLVREVKKYVHNYYSDQGLTLTEIADHLFVNRNYLSQLFKKVTTESFVTYLNKYRIEKAKEKLKERNYLVYEVSEMVGYQNPTYFSKVFKSIAGSSPSDYYQ